MRELLLDTLDQSASNPRAARSALQMSERIFALAESKAGLRAKVDFGIDVLNAVVLDPRLPDAFRERRYPQAKAQVEARRTEFERSIAAVTRSPSKPQPAPPEARKPVKRRRRRKR